MPDDPTLRDLLTLFVRRARLLFVLSVIPAVLIGALAYGFVSREPRVYQSSLTLFVQQPLPTTTGSGPSGTDITGSAALAHTYSDMITEPVVGRAATRAVRGRYPHYQLRGHGLQSGQATAVQAGTSVGTQLVSISISDTNTARADFVATQVAKAFIGHVSKLQQQRYAADQATLQAQINHTRSQINGVSARLNQLHGAPGTGSLRQQLGIYEATYRTEAADLAHFDAEKDNSTNTVAIDSPAHAVLTGPHPLRLAILALVVCLVLTSGTIFLVDYLRDLPQSPQDVQDIAGVPALAFIPSFADQSGRGGAPATQLEPRSAAAESYRLLRTNLQFTDIASPPQVIVVTSALPQDGKSTTASNLAVVTAQAGSRVCLVDGDLRRPRIAKLFEFDHREGLTSLLLRNPRPTPLDFLSSSSADGNLWVVPSGPIPPNPADLLSSRTMVELVGVLRESFDRVIIDSPPVIPVADAALLSSISDGVLLVVDPTRTRRRDIRRAREAINAVNGRLLGVVLNRITPNLGSYYHYYDYDSGSASRDRGSKARTLAQ